MKISVLLTVIGVFVSNSFVSGMELVGLDSADQVTQVFLKAVGFVDADSFEARKNPEMASRESDLQIVQSNVVDIDAGSADSLEARKNRESASRESDLRIVQSNVVDIIFYRLDEAAAKQKASTQGLNYLKGCISDMIMKGEYIFDENLGECRVEREVVNNKYKIKVYYSNPIALEATLLGFFEYMN